MPCKGCNHWYFIDFCLIRRDSFGLLATCKNGYSLVTGVTIVLGSLRSATGWRCDKLPPASQRSYKRRRPGSEAMSRRRFRKFPLASADPRTDFTQLDSHSDSCWSHVGICFGIGIHIQIRILRVLEVVLYASQTQNSVLVRIQVRCIHERRRQRTAVGTLHVMFVRESVGTMAFAFP